MLAHMILLLKMSLRKQEIMMTKCLFKVRYESKTLRMLIDDMITNEVSTNNGQRQIKLAYNDFLYGANKGD